MDRFCRVPYSLPRTYQAQRTRQRLNAKNGVSLGLPRFLGQ
jgi:hypothetical protein